MTLSEYQNLASQSIQKSDSGDEWDRSIHYLGLAGEMGSILAEIKKHHRDGATYTQFKPKLKEEIGDTLWYLSTIASLHDLDLEQIGKENIDKAKKRFGEIDYSNLPLFDNGYPSEEQVPREFEVNFYELEEKGESKMQLIYNNEEQLGNTLTDNAYEDDGYRYHDVFHLAYVAILGWSPVIRKLLKKKRRSNPIVDEVEDGARAGILEELISLFVYTTAKKHNMYSDIDRLDTSFLNDIKNLVKGFEVEKCSAKQWEDAILAGYSVYNQLRKNGGGRVLVSLKNRKLIYIGKD